MPAVRPLLFATATLVLLTGCSRQGTAPNLVLRDSAGTVVARGYLNLPTLPAEGKSFRGPWRLTAPTPALPSGLSVATQYTGEVTNQSLSINLHPHTADNNLSLVAPVTGGTLTGTWHHSTIAGAKEMGTFTLTRTRRGH